MPNGRGQRLSARDLAAEIVRRATGADGLLPYVVRLSNPPTAHERLQLIAARLERRPIVVMPHKCASMQEWIAKYGRLKDQSGAFGQLTDGV
jgi:hypothetical protein